MDTLEICLLGGFLLRRGGAPLEQMPSRLARSLFAYLVTNRERAHTRDLLAGTFWPDMPDSTARRRLSQALWHIRRSTGHSRETPILLSTTDTVRFHPNADFWLDVDEFEWTLEQATPAAVASRSEEADLLEAAVTLYRGDFLAGYFEDWLMPDQDRLRQRMLGALERLTELTMSRGQYEEALIHARRLVQHDPLREEAHQKVMRLAVLLGRHIGAIRQYEELVRILDEELGTEPSQASKDLFEEIIKDRQERRHTVVIAESPLFDTAGHMPFVGRDAERSTLIECLDAALDSKGSLVLIEGEPGVGKTRLLAEVVDDAQWRDMDVLWGRSPPSGGMPFAPFAEALNSGLNSVRARQLIQQLESIWREQLVPLVPRLRAADDTATETTLSPADRQSRMREAISLAIVGLARLVPTLIVLEDVHWADEDTIQALAQLAGRLEPHRLVVAVSYRHAEARERTEVWSLLRALDQRPFCERISLAACSPAQTEELIRRSLALPEVSAEFSQRLHAETGGVPLFVIEALRALYEQGRLGEEVSETLGAAPVPGPIPMTPAVHALVRGRLRGLPDHSRGALDVIATHDGELTLGEVMAATEGDDEQVLGGVDDLLRRRLITEHEGGYHAGHELMRRTVYEDLTLSRKLDLHRRVAFAVESHRPDQVEVLAHHFWEARMPDRAAGYLEKAAARALTVHAYDTAALHLSRAVEALDQIETSSEHQFRVASRLEEILHTLARRAEQERALARMERHASGPQVGDVHQRRAWWLASQDRFPEAVAQAEKALKLARRADDPGREVAALSTLGMIACYAGRAADGVVHLRAAAGFQGADRRQQADARNALGQNLVDLQHFDEAEKHLQIALALYRELNDARGQAEVLGMLGTLHLQRGEAEAAQAAYGSAVELSRSIGYRHGEAVHEMNLAIALIYVCQVAEGRAAFERSAAVFSDMESSRGRAMVLCNSAWLQHSTLGNHKRARAEIEQALEICREIGDVRGEAQALLVLGNITAVDEDLDKGIDLLEHTLGLARELGDRWLTSGTLRELAAFRLVAGRIEAGLRDVEEAEAITEAAGMQNVTIKARALRGRLLLAAGHTEAALRATGSAVAELRPGTEHAYLIPFAHSEALYASGHSGEADHYLELAYRRLMSMLEDLNEDEKKIALTGVPNHRLVVDAWLENRPRTTEHRMAIAAAPSGRPLRAEEWTTVKLTVGAPSDASFANPVARRRHRLLRLIDEAHTQGAAPTISDLAMALSVSPATIRRDLAALRSDGHHVITRGNPRGGRIPQR
jgi:DNA-binding SARP family transcriptional activator/predicted ATPase